MGVQRRVFFAKNILSAKREAKREATCSSLRQAQAFFKSAFSPCQARIKDTSIPCRSRVDLDPAPVNSAPNPRKKIENVVPENVETKHLGIGQH